MRCQHGPQGRKDSFEPSAQGRRPYPGAPARGRAQRLFFFLTTFCQRRSGASFWLPSLPSDQTNPPKTSVIICRATSGRGKARVRWARAHQATDFKPSFAPRFRWVWVTGPAGRRSIFHQDRKAALLHACTGARGRTLSVPVPQGSCLCGAG